MRAKYRCEVSRQVCELVVVSAAICSELLDKYYVVS